MLGIRLLRSVMVLPESVRALKEAPNSPEKYKTLMNSLQEKNYSNFESGMIFIYLSGAISTFAEYPGLQTSIKDLYLKNYKRYDDNTLSTLFWMIKKNNNTDQKFFIHVLDKLYKRIPKLNLKNFIYLTDGCTQYPKLVVDEVIIQIQEKIKALEGKYGSRELNLICSNYSKIYREDLEDVEVFKVLERELLRLGPDVHSNTILSFLNCINKVILRYPSDIPNMMESVLISRAPSFQPDLLCKFLSAYSMIPIYYQYTNLYVSFENIILANPEEYFLRSKTRYLAIAHAYSKLKGFNKIIGLFIKYIPEIPKDLQEDSESLGYFLYSMLRKYPGEIYEAMLLQALYDYSPKLNDLRKKKIIIAMIKRKSRNEFFWSDVQKLGVFWSPEEVLYVSEHKEKLSKIGLIKTIT